MLYFKVSRVESINLIISESRLTVHERLNIWICNRNFKDVECRTCVEFSPFTAVGESILESSFMILLKAHCRIVQSILICILSFFYTVPKSYSSKMFMFFECQVVVKLNNCCHWNWSNFFIIFIGYSIKRSMCEVYSMNTKWKWNFYRVFNISR